MPALRVSFFVRTVNKNNNTIANNAIMPSNKNAEANGIGKITPATPKTNKILKMLEPTIFPMAISDSPLRAAITLVTNSGKLVPIATIVKPITRSETPKYRAKAQAASTVKLLPQTRATSPKMIYNAIFAGLNDLVSGTEHSVLWDITNK